MPQDHFGENTSMWHEGFVQYGVFAAEWEDVADQSIDRPRFACDAE